jgi:hypothetical protein
VEEEVEETFKVKMRSRVDMGEEFHFGRSCLHFNCIRKKLRCRSRFLLCWLGF